MGNETKGSGAVGPGVVESVAFRAADLRRSLDRGDLTHDEWLAASSLAWRPLDGHPRLTRRARALSARLLDGDPDAWDTAFAGVRAAIATGAHS